jgi:hypothetical protein
MTLPIFLRGIYSKVPARIGKQSKSWEREKDNFSTKVEKVVIEDGKADEGYPKNKGIEK